MVAFSAPAMMAIFCILIGIASIIPLVFGLIGFSQRTAYIITAIIICLQIYLQVTTFYESLKY